MIDKLIHNVDYEYLNKKISVDKFEKIVVVLLLVYFSDALDGLGLFEKLFVALSYLIIPFLVIRQWKRFIYVTTRDIPLLLLVIVAVVSIFWSYTPSATIVTSRALVRITLFGIYFATRFSLKEQLRLLAWALGIAALLTLFVGIVIPSTGLTASQWRGAFPHKNTMARTMVISTAAFLTLAFNSNRHSKIKWIGFFLSFSLILLSRGKTALVIFLLLPTLWFIRKVFKQYYKVRVVLVIPLLFFLVASSVFIASNLETILVDVLGKDLSINGRTQLWEELFKMIADRPLLGYGYYGFWNDKHITFLEKNVRYGWVPTHAHSGLIDLALMLGFLGLLLFSVSFLVACYRALTLATTGKTPESFWPLTFLIIMFLFNFNITITILSPFDISLAIFIDFNTEITRLGDIKTYSFSFYFRLDI